MSDDTNSPDNIKDIDLLDMLTSADIEDAVEDKKSDSPIKPNATDFSSIFDMLGKSGNDGSGDITEDLMNWFNGNDTLPSDPLATFLGNAAMKAEFGMLFNMIKNFSRLKRLQDFVNQAEEVYFNPDEIIQLDPDELKKRMESASDAMKNLYEMNRRTIQGIKGKGKEEEMDKLKILLSAIPSNKLKDVIASLNK